MAKTDAKPRRREFSHKTRTGCITCKFRHVKCDEARPHCKRCASFGLGCEGYANAGFCFVEVKPARRTKSLMRKKPYCLGSPPTLTVRVPPQTGINFRNQIDHQYFRFFQEEISQEFSAGFDSSLWDRTVLQACSLQPILRLTLATAALSKSGRLTRQDGDSVSHRQYALHQYGAALRGLRIILQSKYHHSLRIVLIASLLIYCFEGILGHTVSAMSNVTSAINLMSRELTMRKLLHPQRSHSKSQIESHLLIALRRLASHTVVVKDDSSVGPTDPISNTELFVSTLHKERFHIPNRFSDLNEARCTLEEIHYFALPNYRPELILQSGDNPLKYDFPADRLLFSRSKTVISTEPEILKAQLEQWTTAFSDLYAYSQTVAGNSTFIPATILTIQAITLDLTLCRSKQPGPSVIFSKDDSLGIVAFAPRYYSAPHTSSHGAHTEEQKSLIPIKKILGLCRKLLAHPNFVKSFVCGVGIIPPLWSILKMSPERALKVEAVRLLKEMVPRVEGIWSSKSVAEAGELELQASDSQEIGVH